MDANEMTQMYASSAIMNAGTERFLAFLGDRLAQDQKHGLSGIDAVHYHLIQKHNWLPRDVKSLSIEDMKLACATELEEMGTEPEFLALQTTLMEASLGIRPVTPSKK